MSKRKTGDPTIISENIGVDPKDKPNLPSPEITSGVYTLGKTVAVDIKDHLGREWTLIGMTLRKLREKLWYFKSLSRDKIRELIPPIVPQPIQFPRLKGWICVQCRTTARVSPSGEWHCVKCGISGVPESPGFIKGNQVKENPAEKPKEAAQKPAKPVETKAEPKPSLTLKERIAARKAAKGA